MDSGVPIRATRRCQTWQACVIAIITLRLLGQLFRNNCIYRHFQSLRIDYASLQIKVCLRCTCCGTAALRSGRFGTSCLVCSHTTCTRIPLRHTIPHDCNPAATHAHYHRKYDDTTSLTARHGSDIEWRLIFYTRRKEFGEHRCRPKQKRSSCGGQYCIGRADQHLR